MHPCQSCGACCECFRVTFHPSETLPESYGVPAELQCGVSSEQSIMQGTQNHPLRCTALEGVVGESARCTIYENRPSPCRRFQPSYQNGKRNPRCDHARMQKGLKPLTQLA